MVFDYYIAKEGVVEMGQAAGNAASNIHTQLQSIFPSLASAQIWSMDAMTMLHFAQSNNMNLLSIWAIQRDNGGCPGTVDSNTCSGITQNTWDFSHLLEPFTS